MEYSEGNGLFFWCMVDVVVLVDCRKYLFNVEKIEVGKSYDFCVFVFGVNEFSEVVYVFKIYKFGEF